MRSKRKEGAHKIDTLFFFARGTSRHQLMYLLERLPLWTCLLSDSTWTLNFLIMSCCSAISKGDEVAVTPEVIAEEVVGVTYKILSVMAASLSISMLSLVDAKIN